MLIREVADRSKYYHDVLAAQLPAGLSDDNDIVGKAFVIAGMKLGMVKAARLFRETPIEQDIVTAYRQLHNELKETAVEDDLGTAQEIGAQLQSAMEDLYYAHRMGNPNPTVKQNIDMLQKSIRSFNQELNGLGYKYAPTVPGLVARMGTRYVEADNKVAPVAATVRIQPTRTQPNQNVYVAPEKKTTPAAIIHIGKKEDELLEGPIVPRIIHPGRVSVYVRNGKRPPAMIATDIPYEILDRYIEKIMQKYPQFKITDFSFKSADDVKEGNLNEFSPTKPPTGGAGGPKDYGQPTSSRYLGNNKFVLGTTNNYVLTATVDKWGLEWDEDDEIWFLDSPGAVYIADATEGEIELPAPQEQRNQIHDLVSDYLNARNSAELQRVAAYYGHSADGEMATSEGFRVANQQIRGTKNRAQSAYYPTNVKPHVPRLDKPLTDQELARLSQLAGIKSNK